jgi:hypothetical protein
VSLWLTALPPPQAVFPVAVCPKTSKSDQTFLHFALSADTDPDRPSRTSIKYAPHAITYLAGLATSDI